MGRFLPQGEGVAMVGMSLACLIAGGLTSARRFEVGAMALVGVAVGCLRVVPEAPASTPPLFNFDEPCWRTVQGSVQRTSYDVDGSALVELSLRGISDCASTPGSKPLKIAREQLYVNIERNLWNPWPEGARLRLHAKIRPTTRRRNFISHREFGESLTTYLRDNSGIALVSKSDTVRSALEDARVRLIRALSKEMTPTGARLAGALLLGDSRLLTFEQRRVFRESGTAHLLSISGLHLGLIALFIFTLLRRGLTLLALRPQAAEPGRLAAGVTLAVCIAFTFWVGGRPPVVRACVMSGFVLIARLFGFRAAACEALTAAGAALLMYNPEFAQTPGFQLSFAAVLGFVWFAEPRRGEPTLSEVLDDRTRLQDLPPPALQGIASYFISLVRGTVAATAVTTPIIMWHFDHACGLGILGNLVAVPAVGFFALPMLAAVGAVASLNGSDHAGWLFTLLDAGFDALQQVLRFVSSLPGNLYGPTLVQSAAVSLWCCAAILGLQRFRRAAVVFGLVGLVIFAGSWAAAATVNDALTVDFLDVGQGDSTLLTFPDGRRWLIDAAGAHGSYDAGKFVVVPTLKRLGVNALDTVVLTHPDSDHVGGLSSVLSSIPTKKLWDNGQGKNGAGPAYEAAMATAARTGVRIERSPQICGQHTFGDVKVRVLHPCDDSPRGFDPTASFNANSIVVHLSYGQTSFLFTGDIDDQVERRLLKKYPDLHATVLKLAHHGSKTSSARVFLERVAPSAAIASAGPHNAHRLPSLEVIARLRKLGIRLWRTDKNGRIKFSSDGSITRCEPIASQSHTDMAYNH